MTKVDVLRHPTDEDWMRCRTLALNTVGKRSVSGTVSDRWKHDILLAGHSPIRTLMFTVRVELPYYLSTCLVRHKYGVEHYVSSQRNDRQDRYDRRKAPQDAMVTHVIDVNSQELMQIAHMRLCGQATDEMREVVRDVCRAVTETNPEFKPFLMPKCMAKNGMRRCNEYRPCDDAERYLP